MTVTEQMQYLSKGIDPMTGEVFDTNLFRLDARCNNAVNLMIRAAFPNIKCPKLWSVNDRNRPSNEIYEKLRAWRLDMAREQCVSAYIIFSNSDLMSIAESDVMTKEELLNVRGIDQKKFDLYADDLFDILKDYI